MEISRSTPNFQLCQFLLTPEGVILDCEPDAADKICSPDRQLRGRELRDVLISIDPHWDLRLSKHFNEWPSQIYLPSTLEGRSLATGIILMLLRSQDRVAVTCSPSLAPPGELEHLSAQDLPDESATVEQLFLRLRSAEERLRTYTHHFPGILFFQRTDLSFSYIAPGLQEALGVDVKPLMRNGGRFLDLILEADRSKFLADLERNTISGETFSITYRIRHPKQNNILYFMDVRTPRISPSGLLLGYEGVWLDITRQSIAESRLSRSAWKENLATITSGLIHDFSNVMAGIFSLSELYYSSLDKDHPWQRGMSQIMESSKQARKLVRRIIDLNREVAGQPTYHNLEHLLNDQLDLIKAILPKQTELETHFTGKEIPVFMDEVSFRQTILNMAMNSRDATEQNGRIVIATREVAAGEVIFENTANGPWTASRDGVVVSFSDNGTGIDPTHLSRIFDPFFTTKEASKGSGFGLYNARLFVAQSKGRIAVSSERNKGTTFYMYLPLADFTEAYSLEEEERANSQRPRPHIAIYAGIDPSNFELIARMHEQEWEIISFTRPEALRRYLREAPRCPTMLLALVLGADPIAEEILDEMRAAYPQMKRSVLVIGRDLDEIPERVKSKIDLLMDDSLMNDELIRSMEELIPA